MQMMLKMVSVAASLVPGTYSPADNFAGQMAVVTGLVEQGLQAIGGLAEKVPGAAKVGLGNIVNKMTTSNTSSAQSDLKSQDGQSPALKGKDGKLGGEGEGEGKMEGGKMPSAGKILNSSEGSSTTTSNNTSDDTSSLQRENANLKEKVAQLEGEITSK